MALVLHASSPAIQYSATNPVTTASFTPPANSLLVVAWCGNTNTSENAAAPSITDSLSPDLTYTLEQFANRNSPTPVCNGYAALWSATVTTSAAMTITVTNNSGQPQGAIKVWVFTDDAGGTPTLGASAKGAQTSGTAVPCAFVATAANSRGVCVVDDWDAGGAPTAGAGSTLTGGGAADQGAIISYAFALRTTADGVSGNTTTVNVTLPTASPHLKWIAAEVVPAAGAQVDVDATLSITATLTAAGGGFAPPTGLQATAISASEIDVTWDAVPGATGYDVERDGVVIASSVAGTLYQDTGLAPSTEYDYRVRAVSA